MPPRVSKHAFAGRFLLLLLAMVACKMAVVTAAPLNGEKLFTYTQPNGETFKVRLWGDEFFAYQETEDGYLVVRDPRKGFFCYAQVLPDGSDIVSTGVRVGQPKPAGLMPKQRLAKGKAFEKSLPMRARSGVDERGRPIFANPKRVPKGQAAARGPSADADPTNGSLQYAPAPTGDVAGAGDSPAIQFASPATEISGTRVGLVLLASFPDAQNEVTKTPAQINSFFNAPTYTADGNATSVYGYFQIQSGGKLSYTNVVTAWFTAAHNKAYYTDPTTSRAVELAKEGLAVLAGNGFDFTQCDGDNDGQIDGVNVFYAGACVNSWSEGLWPGAGYFDWDPLLSEGMSNKRIQFQITDMPPALGIGTTCHENGHMICRFPDLYPYDGNAAGTYDFSLMGGGDTFHPPSIDAYLKLRAGWITATDINLPGQTNYTLNVDGSNIVSYVNPNNPKEYFLFEMRGETGYEGPYGGAPKVCFSKGLVVYHAKEDGSNTRSSIFTADSPNCDYSTPMELLVIEDNPTITAIPWYDDPTPDSQDAFDTGDVINDTSTPDLAFWSSRGRTIASGIQVSNIQVNPSSLTFRIQNNNPPKITATPRLLQVGSNTTLSVPTNAAWSYAWTKLSGPGTVTFGTPSAATTTASFSAIGIYIVRQTISDGVTQMVSEITITVTAGVNEYLGCYKQLPVGNTWHIGWIEFASGQLQWRNAAGIKWNLFTTSNPDALLTGQTPYGNAMEFSFDRQNGQLVSFTYDGSTYYRCNPIGDNLSVATTKNVALGTTLTASDADTAQGSLSYSVLTPPTNGTLSGTAPNLTYTPNSNFTGGDAFTFKVNDGTYDSTVATVNITVYNVAPKHCLFVITGSGDGEYQAGQQATITADAPPPGKQFDKWLGDVGALANTNSASTTLTMPASDVVVTASYKDLEYLKEYVGYYVRPNPTNGWHYGWIEYVGSQLMWRNQAPASWNLLPSAQADVLVTDSTCPYGAGLTVSFSRVSGRISQFVFNGETFVRQSPVAVGASLTTLVDVPLPVTLTASDPQSNPITYTVLTPPTYGTLSGTAPNLTYTPASGYLGTVSFTFKVNDTQSDSNVATISITVRTNIAPVVNAGPDQGVYLIEGAGVRYPVSGAWFEWDAAKDTPSNNTWTSSTANSYDWTFGSSISPVAVQDSRFDRLTKAYQFPAAKGSSTTNWDGYDSNKSATFEFVISTDGTSGSIFEAGGGGDGFQIDVVNGVLRAAVAETSVVRATYTLTNEDKARFIHVVVVADNTNNVLQLYVDGQLKSSPSWTAGDDWAGTDAAALGGVSGATAFPSGGNTANFTGKMTLFRFYRNQAFNLTNVTTNFNALSSYPVATANLDGSVTDPDDANPAKIWSVVSTNPSGLDVQFGNPSATDTTATFTQPGTYTLRLRANDGIAAPVTDDVIITVYNDALPAAYATWAYGIFDNNFTDKAIGSDPDRDSRSNLMEFALGTDPTRMDMGSLATDGLRHGDPVPVAASGGGFELYFLRRVDHGTKGSVTYTPCFSSDLATFYDNNNPANPILFFGPSGVNPAYEVVKVRFPSLPPNSQDAKFGRIRVEVTP